MLLYCPPSTAGFFSFLRRWRPTADDRQGPNREPLRQHEPRFKVRRRFVCFDRRISALLIFISIIFLWQSRLHSSHRRVALRSPATFSSAGSSTSRKEPDARHQHSAEFARRSMEIPPAVQPTRRQQENVAKEFTPLPSSWRRRTLPPTTTSVKPRGVEFSWIRPLPSIDQYDKFKCHVRAGAISASISLPPSTNAKHRGRSGREHHR